MVNVSVLSNPQPKLVARAVSVYYGAKQALFDIDLDIMSREVTAFIGPSGCGKSTFLRCFNRMNDLIDGCRSTGSMLLDGSDIAGPDVDVVQLRMRIGMVFQKPNPFPKSVYDNVAYGPRLHGMAPTRGDLDEIVETSLRRAGIWNEVKDRVDLPGTSLSGGQQQRLCIARAIATATIEELIDELKSEYTIIIVTHNMQQAARVSQKTAFLNLGRLIEFDETQRIFTNPSEPSTQDYITGRFG